MLVICGLGNIGAEYLNTRHNVGFLALDLIAAKESVSFKKGPKFNCEIGECNINNTDLFLVKPTTFMNNSGLCISKIMQYYKIPLEKLIVIHDDLDVELGKMKTKFGGGNAGHNGIKSIDSFVGKDYWRIRLGIGKAIHRDDVIGYVLGKFSLIEREQLDAVLGIIIENLDSITKLDQESSILKIEK